MLSAQTAPEAPAGAKIQFAMTHSQWMGAIYLWHAGEQRLTPAWRNNIDFNLRVLALECLK
jgi:hypothetical protein